VLRASVFWVWGPLVMLTAGVTGLPAMPLALVTGVVVTGVLVAGALRQRSRALGDVRAVGAALEQAVDAVLAAPAEGAPAERLRRLCELLERGHDDVAALATAQAASARQAVGEQRWASALCRATETGHVGRARRALEAHDPVRALGAERRARLRELAPEASAAFERLAERGERDAERVVAVAVGLRHVQVALARRPWMARPYAAAARIDRELAQAARAEAARLAGAAAALTA
jgi:hypothetical protein